MSYSISLLILISQTHMISPFKKDKSPKHHKKAEQKYQCIVEMAHNYPFGRLREIIHQKSNIFVRRRLNYSSPIQRRVICKAEQILQRLAHDCLIKFHGREDEEGSVSFYYEYVHLTLEKWIIDMGDDVLDGLKNQMLQLSSFLNANGIAFAFDPSFLGLSEDIRLKYFLGEFTVVDAGQQELLARNGVANRTSIQSFFEKFKRYEDQCIMHSTSFFDHRETMCASVTTRESWSLARNSIVFQSASRSKITAKLEKTKNRTSQILNRLKSIRNLQF